MVRKEPDSRYTQGAGVSEQDVKDMYAELHKSGIPDYFHMAVAHPETGKAPESFLEGANNLVLWQKEKMKEICGVDSLEGLNILVLGPGLGTAEVGFAQEGANIVAMDLTPENVAAARALAEENGVADRAIFIEGNMLSEDSWNNPAIQELFGQFDVVWFPESLDHLTDGETKEVLQMAHGAVRVGGGVGANTFVLEEGREALSDRSVKTIYETNHTIPNSYPLFEEVFGEFVQSEVEAAFEVEDLDVTSSMDLLMAFLIAQRTDGKLGLSLANPILERIAKMTKRYRDIRDAQGEMAYQIAWYRKGSVAEEEEWEDAA